ncbi:MAG: hypothetical protein WDN10_03260 [bacterium]
MKSLSDILLKHPVPGLRQSERRRVCAETISSVLGLTIKASQVSYEDETVSLKVSPVIKSEMHLREAAITDALRGAGVAVKGIR